MEFLRVLPNAITLDVSRKNMQVESVGVKRANIIHGATYNETKFDVNGARTWTGRGKKGGNGKERRGYL